MSKFEIKQIIGDILFAIPAIVLLISIIIYSITLFPYVIFQSITFKKSIKDIYKEFLIF